MSDLLVGFIIGTVCGFVSARYMIYSWEQKRWANRTERDYTSDDRH